MSTTNTSSTLPTLRTLNLSSHEHSNIAAFEYKSTSGRRLQFRSHINITEGCKSLGVRELVRFCLDLLIYEGVMSYLLPAPPPLWTQDYLRTHFNTQMVGARNPLRKTCTDKRHICSLKWETNTAINISTSARSRNKLFSAQFQNNGSKNLFFLQKKCASLQGCFWGGDQNEQFCLN